jgi:hypothetical protein
MSRVQRYCLVALAVATMIAVAAATRHAEQPLHTFRITFGLHDSEPASWSGQIEVSGGDVASLTGWHFEGKDAIQGKTGWQCHTHKLIALEQRYPLPPAVGKAPKPPEQTRPTGILCTVRGAAPVVTLSLPKGELKFPAVEVRLGEPVLFLAGQVRVERLPALSLPCDPPPAGTYNAVQDDYPCLWVHYKTNKHYLAWVAYRKENDRVLLAERDGPNDTWSVPIEVAGPGDHFRVAMATTHDGVLWIVWSSQRDHQWNLYARSLQHGEPGNIDSRRPKLGPEIRLTDSAGPNIWHRMTTDRRGRAWLVWQGFRDGRSEIFARCADAEGWHEPIRVSDGAANHWDPAIAADTKEDRVWVGWDAYDSDKGNYGVRVRSLMGGPKPTLAEILVPEDSPLFGAHVSLATDRAGRLWAAWDSSGPQWGKDTGFLYQNSPATRLYASREIRIKCLENGRWLEPAADFSAALPPELKEYNELPQLQPDSDGRMWLAFRHRTCHYPRADGWAAQGRWDVYATAYLGDRWLAPIELPESAGRNDMRTSSQRDRDGNVYLAYASDNRAWAMYRMSPRNLTVGICALANAPRPSGIVLVPGNADRRPGLRERPEFTPVHPREKEQVARIRGYAIEAGGKTYHIYRGDLHRHTDISVDGIGDGSLMDLHRYALDAAALDYVLVGDHNMGHDNEYCWWRTQKANDLYSVPGKFLSMYGYERSVPYPNGHRNVIWADRGHRTLPLPVAAIPAQMAADTGKLYAYLRRTHGICTLHSSATEQGTNWGKHDNALEPFVEIFQGYHTSYEAPGAAKALDTDTARIHGIFKPDGFVSQALEKGYRLGFQASSDHISTHVSYACILAEEFSRKGLIEAMCKRHTYAATDNIVLDVRIGSLGIMGDEVRTDQPRLDVTVLGTGPIASVDILRNAEVIHAEHPTDDACEARFRWEDSAPRKGKSVNYYYVRVIQKDGQMAWGSPIWVHGAQ